MVVVIKGMSLNRGIILHNPIQSSFPFTRCQVTDGILLRQNDARHEKTDLNVFVAVIPNEALAGGPR